MARVHLTRHGRGLVLSAQPERLLSGLAVVVQFLPGVGTALPSPARESSRELLFGVVDKRSIGYLLLLFGGRGGDVRFDIVFADVHVAMGGFPMRPGVLSMKLVLDTAEDDIEW